MALRCGDGTQNGDVPDGGGNRRRRSSVRWFVLTAGIESATDSLARTLLPVVAVSVLGAGTATVGILNALSLAAFLLLSLPIGVLADRWGAPTSVMTIGSWMRAGAATGAVLAWWGGLLEGGSGVAVLIAVALVVGLADVAYTSGQSLLVPRLVPVEDIRPVVGRVQAAVQAGGAVGPAGLTAILVLVVTPAAWIVVALGYLASVAAQRRVRPDASVGPAPVRESALAQARAGIGHLRDQPLLGRLTVANMLNNVAVMGANTLVPVLALTDLGLSPAAYAAVGTAGAGAGILGASIAPVLTSVLGLRSVRVLASCAAAMGVLVVMCAGAVVDVLPGPAVVWLCVQSVLAAAGFSIAMVAGSDLPARLAPSGRLGAVLGAQRTIVLGAMPISAVVFGALGAAVGPAQATWAWLALAVATLVPVLGLPRDSAVGA